MPVIKSQLNPRSDEFRANAARMRGLVEDLKQKAAVISTGGDETARQSAAFRALRDVEVGPAAIAEALN